MTIRKKINNKKGREEKERKGRKGYGMNMQVLLIQLSSSTAHELGKTTLIFFILLGLLRLTIAINAVLAVRVRW